MLKRVLDVLGALAGMALTLPIQAGIALAVYVTTGGPVLFRQVRPGWGGQPFEILKFSTMVERRGPDGQLLADEQRLTPLGRLLRESSLDELPELWNVLRGEMSLVGPRPLLMEYLDRYTAQQARRHEVKPGLTGLAQIKGRNDVSWEERLRLDVWYVDNWSLGLDLWILAKTVTLVLSRRGITPAGQDSMPEFRGSGAGD